MLLGSIAEIKIRKICSHFGGKKKKYGLNIQYNVNVDRCYNKERRLTSGLSFTHMDMEAL